MQYILDETEMEEVRKLRDSLKFLPSVEKLQKMCTKIADEWPAWRGWDGKDEPKPWGCIITERENGQEWYCDDCPVQNICPNQYKEWGQ